MSTAQHERRRRRQQLQPASAWGSRVPCVGLIKPHLFFGGRPKRARGEEASVSVALPVMKGVAGMLVGTCLVLSLLQPARSFVAAPPSVNARSGWLNSLDVQQQLGSTAARPYSRGSNSNSRVGCSSNFRRQRYVRGGDTGQRGIDSHGLEG